VCGYYRACLRAGAKSHKFQGSFINKILKCRWIFIQYLN
jgi:hypothetical protein